MLEHLPDLIDAGVSSFKIEGRMKSVFYVANVVSAYRKAIDSYMADPENYSFDYSWYNEMLKASHREFTTGFYYDKPTNEDQNYQTSAYTREYSFTGKVLSYDTDSSIAVVEQRNKMNLGDTIEVFGPDIDYFEQKLTVLLDEDDNPIESAPHPQQILHIKMNKPVKPNYILRKKKGE